MASAQKPRPTNRFRLTLAGKETIGQFREVSGLDSEQEIVEQKEVDANGNPVIIKVPGNLKWSNIELKRGVDVAKGLWDWRYAVETGGPGRGAHGLHARAARLRRLADRHVQHQAGVALEVHGCVDERELQRDRGRGHHHLPRGLQADVAMRTEFAFTLPRGYVDAAGTVHKDGTMRLATARDEIEPLRDAAGAPERGVPGRAAARPRGHPDR